MIVEVVMTTKKLVTIGINLVLPIYNLKYQVGSAHNFENIS